MISLLSIILMGFTVLVGAALIIGSALFAKIKYHLKFTFYLVGMLPFCISHLVGYLFQNKLLGIEPFQSIATAVPIFYNIVVIILMAVVAVVGLWLVFRFYVGEAIEETHAFSVGAGFASFQALIFTFSFVMDHFSVALEINYGKNDTSGLTAEAIAEKQLLIDAMVSRNPLEYLLVGIGVAAFFFISLATAYAVMHGIWSGKSKQIIYALAGQIVFYFAYYLINDLFGFMAERIFAILVGAFAVWLTWKLKTSIELTPQTVLSPQTKRLK